MYTVIFVGCDMRISVVLVAVLGTLLPSDAKPTAPAAIKCDPTIIESISAFWGEDIPSDLITRSIANQKEVVVETTEGYYPKDSKCIYSFFENSTLSITIVPEEGKAKTTDISLQEKDGVLIDAETKIKRYQVYSDGGVAAFYKCADNGVKGDPEGMIKVQDPEYEEEFVLIAEEILSKLGIKLSKKYPAKCPSVKED